MIEVKEIPGFSNYAVTKDGRVWSKKGKGKWLKPGIMNNGYLHIGLQKNKKRHEKRIHRLVLETYVGPCLEGMECRHLDGNKLNNNLLNLKWGTHKENGFDKAKHGVHKGEKHGQAKLTEQDVKTITRKYKTGLFSQRKIARMYDVSQCTIKNIVNKITWKHVWT